MAAAQVLEGTSGTSGMRSGETVLGVECLLEEREPSRPQSLFEHGSIAPTVSGARTLLPTYENLEVQVVSRLTHARSAAVLLRICGTKTRGTRPATEEPVTDLWQRREVVGREREG